LEGPQIIKKEKQEILGELEGVPIKGNGSQNMTRKGR